MRKAERRAKAEAKRELMMAEYRRTGLEAQRKDRARRAQQRKQREETEVSSND